MVALPTSLRDSESVTQLSDWLAKTTRFGERLLRLPGEPWGGSKQPEAVIFAAALRDFDCTGLITRVGETAWSWPDAVQLFIRDQEDASFGVWMFVDGVFRQVLAPVPL